MPYQIKITALICIIFGYLFLGIGIPLHMAHMSDHGMSMKDCPIFPFSQGNDSTLYSHLSIWQSLTLIFAPFLFLFGWVYLEKKPAVYLRKITWRLSLRNYAPDPPLQHLFSQGILHSKAP